MGGFAVAISWGETVPENMVQSMLEVVPHRAPLGIQSTGKTSHETIPIRIDLTINQDPITVIVFPIAQFLGTGIHRPIAVIAIITGHYTIGTSCRIKLTAGARHKSVFIEVRF